MHNYNYVWITLLLSVLSSTIIAQDNEDTYIHVSMEYTSMFPGEIQVKDKVCMESKNIECEKAEIKVNGRACQQDDSLSECQEAQALLDSKFCIKGLVYGGRMSKDEKLDIKLCKSYAGFGNVSVRNAKNSESWTNYSLISDGAQITYP